MKEKIILKSTHPEEYPDLVIECRVIPNDKIGEYLDTIPDEKKFYAFKNGNVIARHGIPGEKIKTVLKTTINGREYILSEEETTVKRSEYQDEIKADVVVTNISSKSKEEYVVKYGKFMKSYEFDYSTETPTFRPYYCSRLLTQVDENIIIITAWGEKAVCLEGGFIVTYNAIENDYNVLEKGAYESTYCLSDLQKRYIKK